MYLMNGDVSGRLSYAWITTGMGGKAVQDLAQVLAFNHDLAAEERKIVFVGEDVELQDVLHPIAV